MFVTLNMSADLKLSAEFSVFAVQETLIFGSRITGDSRTLSIKKLSEQTDILFR